MWKYNDSGSFSWPSILAVEAINRLPNDAQRLRCLETAVGQSRISRAQVPLQQYHWVVVWPSGHAETGPRAGLFDNGLLDYFTQ
jgi:hypothetical protein